MPQNIILFKIIMKGFFLVHLGLYDTVDEIDYAN